MANDGQQHLEKLFEPLTTQEEYWLLNNDSAAFPRTKQYINGLIVDALNRFELTPKQFKELRQTLLSDVVIAAANFTRASINTEYSYKFSTYFTWYIAQRINAVPDLKRRLAA